MSYCSNCGAKLAEGVNFCSACGTRVSIEPNKCSNCGAVITEGDAFCSNCGAKVVSVGKVALEENKNDSKDKRELDRVESAIIEAVKNEHVAKVFAVVGLVILAVGVYFYTQTAKSWGITYHPNTQIGTALMATGGMMTLLTGILGMYFDMKKDALIRMKRHLEK